VTRRYRGLSAIDLSRTYDDLREQALANRLGRTPTAAELAHFVATEAPSEEAAAALIFLQRSAIAPGDPGAFTTQERAEIELQMPNYFGSPDDKKQREEIDRKQREAEQQQRRVIEDQYRLTAIADPRPRSTTMSTVSRMTISPQTVQTGQSYRATLYGTGFPAIASAVVGIQYIAPGEDFIRTAPGWTLSAIERTEIVPGQQISFLTAPTPGGRTGIWRIVAARVTTDPNDTITPYSPVDAAFTQINPPTGERGAPVITVNADTGLTSPVRRDPTRSDAIYRYESTGAPLPSWSSWLTPRPVADQGSVVDTAIEWVKQNPVLAAAGAAAIYMFTRGGRQGRYY
jgi:hypothetical protein